MQEDIIDVCQRDLQRKILNIRLPEKLGNNAFYERATVSPRSKIMKKRRLTWYGHLLRLPEETPAKKALREVLKSSKKPRGGQKHTWLKLITKDLEKAKVKVEVSDGGYFYRNYAITNYHELLAKKRQYWQMVVNSAMS